MLNKTYPSLSTCSKIPAHLSTLLWSPWSKIPRLYPTFNEKFFLSTSPSLPASSNQTLPFLLLSSLYGDTLLEHWSPSPSLVWKDIAQWWRYGLGTPSFLLSNKESVGWNLWGKSVSIRKETLMTLSSWKTVFTKLVLKCTFGLLSLGWLDFFANEVPLTLSISMLMIICYELTQGTMKTTSSFC